MNTDCKKTAIKNIRDAILRIASGNVEKKDLEAIVASAPDVDEVVDILTYRKEHAKSCRLNAYSNELEDERDDVDLQLAYALHDAKYVLG